MTLRVKNFSYECKLERWEVSFSDVLASRQPGDYVTLEKKKKKGLRIPATNRRPK
jgi:hypothetical protein